MRFGRRSSRQIWRARWPKRSGRSEIPTRVRILDALSRAELCVCDIATLLSLGESAVSHQLRLLRSLRLVRSRRAGRMVFYALDDAHILRLFAQGLEHVEEAMPVSRRAATGAER